MGIIDMDHIFLAPGTRVASHETFGAVVEAHFDDVLRREASVATEDGALVESTPRVGGSYPTGRRLVPHG